MNEELKKAIEDSKLLSDDQKKNFLATAGNLTPEQVKEVLSVLQKMEFKNDELIAERTEKEQKAARNYLETLHHIFPKAMKKIESNDRTQEISNLDNLLSELNNS